MKNFLLFGGEIYYAGGGMEDFIKDFDTLQEATEFANSVFAGYGSPMEDRICTDRPFSESAFIQWWHVFDTAECSIVAKSKDEPH